MLAHIKTSQECETALTSQYQTLFLVFLFSSVVVCLSVFLSFSLVLGKLGPGQSGPGQLGPGQLGPGAQLSGAQFATFGGRTVWPRTTGPRGPTVRGPVVRGPTVRGPIVRGPICLEPNIVFSSIQNPRNKFSIINLCRTPRGRKTGSQLNAQPGSIHFSVWDIRIISDKWKWNTQPGSILYIITSSKPSKMRFESGKNFNT